jgi:hypothetical protein
MNIHTQVRACRQMPLMMSVWFGLQVGRVKMTARRSTAQKRA